MNYEFGGSDYVVLEIEIKRYSIWKTNRKNHINRKERIIHKQTILQRSFSMKLTGRKLKN